MSLDIIPSNLLYLPSILHNVDHGYFAISLCVTIRLSALNVIPEIWYDHDSNDNTIVNVLGTSTTKSFLLSIT